MKVLVLTAAYPAPSEPERAVYIENISRALAEAGGPLCSISLSVVAPRVRKEDPRIELRGGIRVRRFRYPSGGLRLKEMGRPSPAVVGLYLVSALAATLAELGREPTDAILCHWALPGGPVAALAAWIARVPLVVVAHGSDIHHHAETSRIARWLAAFALRRAACVLAVSADLAGRIRTGLGVPPERIRVLSMGIDSRLFRPAGGEEARAAARRHLGFQVERPLILFVGDLIPAKGVPELVEAWRGLIRSGIDCSLCLVGDGPLRRGAVADPSDPRLGFPGRLSQADLAAAYRAADLLVLASHAEGSPLVVMEALASGLPVVATRVGGIPDLVEDGVQGILVEPRDRGALEGALRRALSGDTLAGLRRNVAAAPRDLSAEARAAEMRQVLLSVAGGGCHRG